MLWVANFDDDGPAGRKLDHAEGQDVHELVRWGRQRCGRVLVYGRDGELYWAGDSARPDDVPHSWAEAPPKAR